VSFYKLSLNVNAEYRPKANTQRQNATVKIRPRIVANTDMAPQPKIRYSCIMIVSHTKLLVLFVLFIGAGAAFTVTGGYMLSKKYLASLGDKKRLGKAAGSASFALGVLTVGTGIMFFAAPDAAAYIVVIYLGLLFILACGAMIAAKVKK